jgi:hypothetical protein
MDDEAALPVGWHFTWKLLREFPMSIRGRERNEVILDWLCPNEGLCSHVLHQVIHPMNFLGQVTDSKFGLGELAQSRFVIDFPYASCNGNREKNHSSILA